MCCRIDYFGRWIVSGTNYIINNFIVITVCLIRGNIGMINKRLIGMRPLTFIVEISLVSIWDGLTGRLIIVVQIADMILHELPLVVSNSNGLSDLERSISDALENFDNGWQCRMCFMYAPFCLVIHLRQLEHCPTCVDDIDKGWY